MLVYAPEWILASQFWSYSVGHYPTQLILTPKKSQFFLPPPQGSDLSSFWRILLYWVQTKCTHFRLAKTKCTCRVQNYRLVWPSPATSQAKLKNISAGTLPGHFHLIATSLGCAMRIRRRSWIGRPSVLHILPLGEDLSRLQIMPSS